MEPSEKSRLVHKNLLHPVILREKVKEWLKEDTPNFDYGGFVVGEKVERAFLLCKSPGVLSGVPFFEEVFKVLDCQVDWHFSEGTFLEPICKVATVTGKVRNILLGERVALNCITRASGISSLGKKLCDVVYGKDGDEWHGEIAGTRKTTPGFRLVEKYALLIGGMSTHRYDLSSMIMLKDNHIWSAGSITQVVKDAKSVGGFSSKVEVECRSLQEGLEAAQAGADVVMLDNFKTDELHTTAKQIKQKYPGVVIEASGGVSEETIKAYVGEHVDVISLGKVTQGYDTVDFSLKIQKNYYTLG